MDVAAIIVMTIVLLILAGVIIFLIKDYLKYKEQTDNSLADSKKNLQSEQSTRLSNIAHVINGVNSVNNSIYREFATASNQTMTQFATLSNTQQRGLAGMGKFMQFKSDATSTGSNITLFDMPGYAAPDVNLLQHVTMINGMTIKEIGSNEYINNVMFCSKGANPRCIKIPDNDGNTVLTSLKTGSKIVLDSDSDIQGVFNFKSSGPSAIQYGSIQPTSAGYNLMMSSSNNMFLRPDGGKLGISTSSSFDPTAMLHVQSLSTTNDAFRVTCANQKSVFIDKDGALNVEKIKIGDSIIEKNPNGNNLLITANNGITVSTGTTNPTTFSNNVVVTAATGKLTAVSSTTNNPL